jgi:hypothetical protein
MEFIKTYDNAIEPELCDEIIRIFETNPEKQYDGMIGGSGRVDKKKKICKELTMTYEISRSVIEKLQSSLKKHYVEYIETIPSLHNLNLVDESWRIKKYNQGEGFFNWHVDNMPSHKGRLLSAIFYLNDVAEGGQTLFDLDQKIKDVKPVKGKLLIFPSLFCYKHKGSVPFSNDKYVITSFLRITDLL